MQCLELVEVSFFGVSSGRVGFDLPLKRGRDLEKFSSRLIVSSLEGWKVVFESLSILRALIAGTKEELRYEVCGSWKENSQNYNYFTIVTKK